MLPIFSEMTRRDSTLTVITKLGPPVCGAIIVDLLTDDIVRTYYIIYDLLEGLVLCPCPSRFSRCRQKFAKRTKHAANARKAPNSKTSSPIPSTRSPMLFVDQEWLSHAHFKVMAPPPKLNS